VSSATTRDLDASHRAINAAAPSILTRERAAQLQRQMLSPRQRHLDVLWRWYDCSIYDNYRTDWRGKRVIGEDQLDTIVQSGFIPPGFYDAGQTTPLKFRKPSTPSNVVKLVVNRLSGMVFSERTNPTVAIPADANTEDALRAACEDGGLWDAMAQAREPGGAMGSVAVGFKFVDGRLAFEVFDPRWTFVTFADGSDTDVASIDKRVIYLQEDQDPDTGDWVTTPIWHRHTIDAENDTLYKPALVSDDGTEPKWEVASQVAHGLGFCPVVWIQNLPRLDSLDGDPDCHGAYEKIDEMDRLWSQAHKGTIANCDPTVVIIADVPMEKILKGSDNSIQVPVGSTASYLEMAGGGIERAMDLYQRDRQEVLDHCDVVLPEADAAGAQTATEINRRYAAMLVKVGKLRRQYGSATVKLLKLVLRAISILGEEGAVVLPPKAVRDPNTGEVTIVERKFGRLDVTPELHWPPHFDPAPQDVVQATQAAVGAVAGGLLGKEQAVAFVAPYFKVQDPAGMNAGLRKQEADEQARQGAQMMGFGGMRPAGGFVPGQGAD
jgi:hypothetical protein